MKTTIKNRAPQIGICSAASIVALLTIVSSDWSFAATLQAEQITHDNNSDPSFSPNGRRMVAIATIASVEQLVIMDVDGRNSVRLTSQTLSDHEDPSWSPDGRRIAYVSKADGGEVIHIMDTDGTNDRPLTPSGQRAIHPSWSSDNQTIIYCTDDDLHPPKKNAAEIYAIDLQTKAIHMLIAGGINTYPNYSPDGRRIAFRKMVGETNSEVFVADADGSHEINLTNNPAFDGWPAWSPDERRITFASNREGNHKIYVMNADGSAVRLIADTQGRGTAPQWTKDGKRIFFTVCRRITDAVDCEIFTGKS